MLYKKILLPVDINDSDSWEKTLPTCISILEKDPEAKLWVISVIPSYGLGSVEEYFPKGWIKDVSAKTKTELKKIIETNIPSHIEPTLLVERGVVYEAIIDKAAEIKADLIVMSASNVRRKDFLLGPNVARVARHAEASVLITR